METEFCVESKSAPGTYFLSKKLFAQVTANAQHHLIENRKEKLSPVNVVHKPAVIPSAPQTPLLQTNMDDFDDSKGIVAASAEMIHTVSGVPHKSVPETPLRTPTLNFDEDEN